MIKNILSISTLLVVLTACTQSQPAQVELKGSHKFGRNASSSYSSTPTSSYSSSSSVYNSSPTIIVSEETEQSASVDSIGISDLSPPPKVEQKPEIKSEPITQSLSQPVTEKKEAPIGTVKTTVNPWTNKPRSEIEARETTSEIKQEAKINAKGEKVILIKKEAETKPEFEAEPKAEAELKENLDKETKTEAVHEKKLETKTENKIENKSKNSAELKWPVASKKIISSFGNKGVGKANDGINIAAKEGDPVWAVADGEVVYVSNEMKGFGNMVFIKHKGEKTTSYAHLGRIVVDKYDRVKQGDVIGYIGATGNNKKPQLFFSLHKGKEAIDPQKHLSKDLAGL